MGEGTDRGLDGWVFVSVVVGIVALVAAQSATHLIVVLHLGRVGTVVDLDRSNGLPDVISTVALVAAVGGAVLLARRADSRRQRETWVLAALLAALAVADTLHDGPHPYSGGGGWYVIALVVATGAFLGHVGLESGVRTRATLGVAGVILVASFLVNGLDRADQWFERARGDPIGEYQIVAKEGLELLGWSLVALALWDEAFPRRGVAGAVTARASRAQAPRRRRAA